MRLGHIWLAAFAVAVPVALCYSFVADWDQTPNVMSVKAASREREIGESLGVGLLFGVPFGLLLYILDKLSRWMRPRKPVSSTSQ